MRIGVEVGFYGAFALADHVGLVGFETVEGEAVLLGIDSDGSQSQFIRGAENADSDFAAVEG